MKNEIEYQKDPNGEEYFTDSTGRKVFRKNLANPEIKPRVLKALLQLGKDGLLGKNYHLSFKALEHTATKDLQGSTIAEKACALGALSF